jgi:hypothetical protein
MLPNIQDDAINALLGITEGNISYATYTQVSSTTHNRPSMGSFHQWTD